MKAFLATTLALVAPALALADEQPTAPAPAEEQPAAPPAAPEYPPPASAAEPAPAAAPMVAAEATVVEQTRIDNVSAYGRKGTFELGGHTGMMMAPGFRNVNFSPTFGWFVSDGIELTTIAGVSNIKAGDSSSTVWSALLEPSYHVPLNRSTFGFFGVGVGAAYVSGLGTGLAVSPRIGANVLVGRSGVLTPSFSYEYTTHNVESVGDEDMKNITHAAVSSAMRINIGYTAMW